ncbi:unnamed protein product [Rodentolepis nana]|uniref:Vesicle-fusing ATPase n=1 Tax=Rodentolepis nana TaxID=102285 RepID=A0A0R3TBP3_RODNA|nr:unnamed protein product [Rodentolepis nana]
MREPRRHYKLWRNIVYGGALRRAGRFDITIHVPPPDVEARKAILQLELSRRSTSSQALDSSWLEAFARDHLEGYTGAEVVGVVQTAAELTRDSLKVEINREQLLKACERLPPTTLEQYYAHLQQVPHKTSMVSSADRMDTASSHSSRFSNQSFFFITSTFVILVLAIGFQLLLLFSSRDTS